MIRFSSYLILGVYMTWKRFATRYSNFKVFVVVYIVTETLKVVQENILDNTVYLLWQLPQKWPIMISYLIVYNSNFSIISIRYYQFSPNIQYGPPYYTSEQIYLNTKDPNHFRYRSWSWPSVHRKVPKKEGAGIGNHVGDSVALYLYCESLCKC